MNKRILIFLGIVLTAIAVWLLIKPTKFFFIERINNLAYDVLLEARVLSEDKHPPPPNIVIIDIDDKSLSEDGQWPWPRTKLAELVNKLKQQGTSVIAFDLLFAEKENNIAVELLNQLKQTNALNTPLGIQLQKNKHLFENQGDQIFANSLADSTSILAIGFLPRPQTQNNLSPPPLSLKPEQKGHVDLRQASGYIANIPVLQEAAKASGFINIFADSDGIIRRTPLLVQYKDHVYPSLALQSVLSFLGEDFELVTAKYGSITTLEGIQIGDAIIPTDAKGQVLIPFIGRSYSFQYYSASDVLHERLPKEALLGKIAFIGTSATGLSDLQATAIQNPFPGVEIQATVANGILLNHFSNLPPWILGANITITIFLGFIAAFIFPSLGPRTLGIIILLIAPTLIIINNWVWRQTGIILSLLMPGMLVFAIAVLNILYGYLFETRRREQIKEMFGQYVPKKHIDEMLKTSGDYGLRGESRDMSVLFADIRDFTSISENMAAAELVELLNDFFTPMTEIIFKHRGTIDKYVGDLVMAFWGAPLKDKSHARHAIQSALEMREKIKELQIAFEKRGWPPISIGVGINSGVMSVGDMGSRFRRNYTVLGDAVNLASRIEGLTRFYGVDIIASEDTHLNQDRFIFRKLDRVKVKGKQAAVAIYEVVCLKSNLTSELTEELKLYHHALNEYFRQNWDAAETGMKELQERYPDKKIYSIYLFRINEFKVTPPPTDWDGVYSHQLK